MTTRAAIVTGVVLAAGAVPALASVGTGVQSGPVVLAKAAKPGRTYKLPGVYVTNTGTLRTRYRFSIQRLPPKDPRKRTAPARWVAFRHRSMVLDPGQGKVMPMTLKVPKGARAAKYASDVVVTSVPRGSAFGGTSVGVASATALEFTVAAAKRKAGGKRR